MSAKLFPLLHGRRLIGIDEVIQQLIDVAGVRCHAAFQHVVGIRLVPKKLGYLAAQVDEPFAYFEVVLAVVVGTHRVAGHVHLLPQFPLCGVGHEGRVAGIVECEEPAVLGLIGLIGLMGLLPCQGGCVDGGLGQSVQLFLVCNFQCVGFVFLQQIL